MVGFGLVGFGWVRFGLVGLVGVVWVGCLDSRLVWCFGMDWLDLFDWLGCSGRFGGVGWLLWMGRFGLDCLDWLEWCELSFTYLHGVPRENDLLDWLNLFDWLVVPCTCTLAFRNTAASIFLTNHLCTGVLKTK